MNNVFLQRALPHGHCVILRFGEGIDWSKNLTETEAVFAEVLPPLRRQSFVAGRAALRMALQMAGCEHGDLLPNERGGPNVASGFSGSISHKDGLAAALATKSMSHTCGVDLEIERPRRPDISRHVLTNDELEADSQLPAEERLRLLLLRFSLKEAIYKAIDPFLQRYVGFKEVRVTPQALGAADVEMLLPEGDPELVVEAQWERLGAFILATAKAEAP